MAPDPHKLANKSILALEENRHIISIALIYSQCFVTKVFIQCIEILLYKVLLLLVNVVVWFVLVSWQQMALDYRLFVKGNHRLELNESRFQGWILPLFL